MTRRPALLLLVLLTGCGGGGTDAEAPCAPVAAPSATTQARPVPKRDAREIDQLTPVEAALVAQLHAAEQGHPPAPAKHAAAPSPSCAAEPASPEEAGHAEPAGH